jgi:hypothetical protein
MLSVKILLSVKPIENPTGCLLPIAAKAKFLRLLLRVEVMILTAEGRQNAMAIPLRARKRMISLALRASPQPIVKNDCKTELARYMNLEPRASAIEPERRRAQPQVSVWMEDSLKAMLKRYPYRYRVRTNTLESKIVRNAQIDDYSRQDDSSQAAKQRTDTRDKSD